MNIGPYRFFAEMEMADSRFEQKREKILQNRENKLPRDIALY